MKSFIFILTFVTASFSVSAQSGYCFSSSTRGSFENTKATKLEKVKAKEEQTNIFTFSFPDSLLVHHIVLDDGTKCQFYKIITVTEVDSYSKLIQVKSGVSGSDYFYYITSNEEGITFYQIDTIDDDEKMSGTRFGDIGSIDLTTYEQ